MSETVFAVLPATAIAYGVSLGLARRELLDVAGLSEQQLADPDNLVAYDSLVHIWRLFTRRFPDRPLGFEYGQLASVQLFGVVGQACANAPTLQKSLDIYFRFSRLIDPFAGFALRSEATHTIVSLDHEPRVVAMPEVMEMLLVSGFVIGRQLSPALEQPARVWFRHERRHPLKLYERFFGCEVVFGADSYRIAYPRLDLGAPLRGANPAAGRYLERYLEEAFRDAHAAERDGQRNDEWRAQLEARIEAGFSDGDVREARVAKELAMSSRSLQRALQERGTSFGEVLARVRYRRALTLLDRRELSAAEVAFMLGYSDARSFYRAFRQWHGTTPGQYRRDRQQR